MYTIKQAAARTGVSVPLLRAWERRYGIVEPRRTASGYRLYDDDAIDRVRTMRGLVAAGWTPSEAARALLAGETLAAAEGRGPAGVPATDPAGVPTTDPAGDTAAASGAGTGRDAEGGSAARASATRASLDVRPPTSDRHGPIPALRDRLVDAAARLDTAALHEALDEGYALGSFEFATEEIVLPALRLIGERWAAGTLDVAAEHASSAIIAARLAAAFNAAARPGRRVDAVVGLPPGSRHELGALAFAAAARRAGLGVLYLGADVPAASWRESVNRSAAAAAVVVVPTRDDVPGATEVLALLGRLEPAPVRAVGGGGAGDVRGQGMLRLPESLTEAAALLRRRLR